MARSPDSGVKVRKPVGDQAAAVLEWVGATVPGFALFRSRTDGVLLSVSDTWLSVTGLSPEGCIGRPLIDLVHADDRARVERLLGRDAGAAPRAEIEIRLTEPSGRARNLAAVRGHHLSSGGGRVLVGIRPASPSAQDLDCHPPDPHSL